MSIPPKTDAVWKDLLVKQKTYDFEFLALKMLLGRLTTEVERDSSQENLENCAAQLVDLFSKNANLPPAVRDLKKITG